MWGRLQQPGCYSCERRNFLSGGQDDGSDMQRHSGGMFAINWNVTAPDAPTVAMTDLSLIAFPYPNELGTARFRLLSRASASVRRRRREPSNLQSSRRRARARRRPRVGTKSTSPAKFGRSHRPARRRRASRSSDGSLARDPRGNESRADQRLSFPRLTARPPAFRHGVRNSAYTAHGFRSSFRDWAGNETHYPREPAEHAPAADVISDKAEQAYRRSDALARRRELMDARAWHCEGADGYTPMTWPCPARPFVGRNAKATPPDVGKPQSCSQFYSGPQTAIYLGTTWALGRSS
jgi:hypothetical protein